MIRHKTVVVALKSVAQTSFVLWVVLTLIVLFFLPDRWQHPDMKSISDRDLIDYAVLSGFLLPLSGLFWFLAPFVNRRSK